MATDFLHILIGLPTLASCSFRFYKFSRNYSNICKKLFFSFGSLHIRLWYVVIKRWFEGNQGWEKEEISQATLVLKLSKWFIYQRKSVRSKYIQSITIVPKTSGKDSRKQLKYDYCSIGPFGLYAQLIWRFS